MADGEKSECLYFDHPFWPRTREEFYQRRSTALEREQVPGNDGYPRGLTAEGVVPSDTWGPPSGRREKALSRTLQARWPQNSVKVTAPVTNADDSHSISASRLRVRTG
jgi:hypothetical protein